MRIESPPLDELAHLPGVAMRRLLSQTPATAVRVDLAVLHPGASLPRHRTVHEQVFAVVAGHGRVAGDDDVEHEVGPGSVVTWARGEQHTSWADSPMTVVLVERTSTD